MSEMVTKNSAGGPVQVKSEPGRPMLDTDFMDIAEALDWAKSKYERDRDDYFNTLPDEPAMEAKSKRWQRSAYELMRWAGTSFNHANGNEDQRKEALDIMDRVTKDSSIRLKNMIKHTGLMIDAEKKKEQTPEALQAFKDLMDQKEYETSSFFRNAVKTHSAFIDHFLKGDNYVNKVEVEAAQFADDLRKQVLPKDRVYIPGRIIPPYPVPEGQRVPRKPDPYIIYKSQPVEAYEFDYEEEEIVLKEDYVSPDGLVDRDSVKFDRKNKKCTMKYRGGVPVTWDYWKADTTADMPEAGSWAEDYIYREYWQTAADEELGVLIRRPEEYEDTPPYNIKPQIE